MQGAIRKAAILVRALDAAAADALLAQLDAATAAQIREAARKLRPVDAQEQEAVLAEFFAKGGPGGASGRVAAPVDRLARRAASDGGDELVLEHRSAAPAPRRPFQFLETVDAGRLAARLRAEHPQTIAIVAAHAPRRLAGELLCRLPDPLRTDVLLRVIEWQGTEAPVLEEMERMLELSLAPTAVHSAGAAGLQVAAEILEGVAQGDRGDLLSGLARRDAKKADVLRFAIAPRPEEEPETVPFRPAAVVEDETPVPPHRTSQDANHGGDEERIPFAEFPRLDDRMLTRVFAAAQSRVTLLALAGASPELVERLMRRLPRKEAARLRRRMETLGPFRLSDIETAQEELSRIAARLARERPARGSRRAA
jgi:flagellar motor switch protein FliG